jgi:arylsulfatase
MPKERPNILVLFTDQQRADSIGALGHPQAKTPHMDRLVREGTTFGRAYTPSPVCCPARCCLLYGRHPERLGLTDNGPMPPPEAFVSYAEYLGRYGYRTHAAGKCHFTPEKTALRGFQTRRSQEEVTADPATDDYVAWLKARGGDTYEVHGARGQMYYVPQISSQRATEHPSAWVADESVAFLREEEANGGGRPWMLFSSFVHPHPPFAPPKPWHKLFNVSDFPIPDSPGEDRGPFCWVNRHQNRYKYRDGGFDRQMVRLIRAYYHACISFVDFQFGRILAELERSGRLDNTLIVFASDHGELLGDFGCFGKRSMHDVSARIPLVVRQPGSFAAGARCDTPASLIDLFPTFAAAAGLDPAGDGVALDGEDLAKLAARPTPERVVFSHFGQGPKGIYLATDARWKLVHSAGDGQSWFYDRARGPVDQGNLYASTEPEVVEARERLEQVLLGHLRDVGETVAVATDAGQNLHWRTYPPVDESWRTDWNQGLLHQDYPDEPKVLPGYSTRAI